MLEYLEQHESEVLFGALVIAFCVIALAEQFFPRRPGNPNLGFRWANNIGLAAVTTAFNRFVYLATGLGTTHWVNEQGSGLIPWLDAPWAVSFMLLLLILAFGDYVTHRLMHVVPVLWRLHAVHHSDTEFDLTTTYRNHPFAALVLLLLRLPLIALLAAPVAMLLVYEVLRLAQDLWSHSNTRIPERVDRYLRWFLVTPDFHRVHHSSDRQYTDSNFSSTLPWFDYLFGSYRRLPATTQRDMEIGLESFRERRNSRLDQLLLMPLVGDFARERSDRRRTRAQPQS
ncbi:MAG: sterol desaturase family protein [Halioglobus sp.]|nr:sterol desaturase family protein [Halioglobus sp.]